MDLTKKLATLQTVEELHQSEEEEEEADDNDISSLLLENFSKNDAHDKIFVLAKNGASSSSDQNFETPPIITDVITNALGRTEQYLFVQLEMKRRLDADIFVEIHDETGTHVLSVTHRRSQIIFQNPADRTRPTYVGSHTKFFAAATPNDNTSSSRGQLIFRAKQTKKHTVVVSSSFSSSVGSSHHEILGIIQGFEFHSSKLTAKNHLNQPIFSVSRTTTARSQNGIHQQEEEQKGWKFLDGGDRLIGKLTKMADNYSLRFSDKLVDSRTKCLLLTSTFLMNIQYPNDTANPRAGTGGGGGWTGSDSMEIGSWLCHGLEYCVYCVSCLLCICPK